MQRNICSMSIPFHACCPHFHRLAMINFWRESCRASYMPSKKTLHEIVSASNCNNAGSTSTAERSRSDHSTAANPASSVSAAPVSSVRRGKCISIFDDRQKFMDVMFLASFHSHTMHNNIFIMCHLHSHFITHLQRAANESGGSTIPTHGRRPPPPSEPTSFVWECPTPPSSNSSWPRESIRVCCTIPTRVSIRPSSWSSATSSRRWMGGIWSGVWPWRRVTTRGRTGAFSIGMNWGDVILPCRHAFFGCGHLFSSKYHMFYSNWICIVYLWRTELGTVFVISMPTSTASSSSLR